MDKQKQIEEMAKVLEFCCNGENIENCNSDRSCDSCRAKYLYNAGYRKIPENAVVLTGTETEESLEYLLIDFDEMSFYPATLCPNPDEYVREWKRRLIYIIGQLRKEMAEKFAERLKKDCVWRNDFDHEGVAHPYTILELEELDEICKELTEGKSCEG